MAYTEVGSIKVRDVPTHKKGYKNEWGALLQHQAEIQASLEDESKQKELERQAKYRQELHSQLATQASVKRIEDSQRHNYGERKMLEENAKLFEHKESQRVLDQKLRGMAIMDQNRVRERERGSLNQQRSVAERDMYNDQMNEINQHAEQRDKAKKDWQNWQKTDLTSSYKQEMERHRAQKQMDKLKDERFAQDFAGKVQGDNKKHDEDIRKMQEKQRAILEGQSNTVIRDENELKKHAAVSNMKSAYDRAEKEREENENTKKKNFENEKKNTTQMLQAQMSRRQEDRKNKQQEAESYRGFLDKTVGLLTDKENEEKKQKQDLIKGYRSELKNQIHEQKDAEAKRWNEMDDRTRKMNVKNIAAFEAAEARTNAGTVVGLDIDKTFHKDDFKRKTGGNSINFGKTTPGETFSIKKPFTGGPISTHSPSRLRNYQTGKEHLSIPAHAATTQKLAGAAPAPSTGPTNNMPTYNLRTSRARSSMNYEAMSGRRSPPQNINPITGMDENDKGDDMFARGRNSMVNIPRYNDPLKTLQDTRTAKESPWNTDPAEVNPPVPAPSVPQPQFVSRNDEGAAGS